MGFAQVTCSTARPRSGVWVHRVLWVSNGNKGLIGGGEQEGCWKVASKQSLQADKKKHEPDSSELEAFCNYYLTPPCHLQRDCFVFLPPQATIAFKSDDLKCRVELQLMSPLLHFPSADFALALHPAAPFSGFTLCTTETMKKLGSGRNSYVFHMTPNPVFFHLVKNIFPDLSFNLFFWMFFQFKNMLGLFLDPSHQCWEPVSKQIYSFLSFVQYLTPYLKCFFFPLFGILFTDLTSGRNQGKGSILRIFGIIGKIFFWPHGTWVRGHKLRWPTVETRPTDLGCFGPPCV